MKLVRRATECGELNDETVKAFAGEEIERLAGLLENLSNRSADCLWDAATSLPDQGIPQPDPAGSD